MATRTTLYGFLSGNERNAWVSEPGFISLYVRKSERVIDGEWFTFLDLATIDVKKPGTGTLTRLINWSNQHYNVYIESVLNDRLADHLRRIGFTEHSGNAQSFFRMKTKVPVPC